MMEKWLLGTGAGEGGGLAEGGVGEFGDALGEPDLGAETEVAGGFLARFGFQKMVPSVSGSSSGRFSQKSLHISSNWLTSSITSSDLRNCTVGSLTRSSIRSSRSAPHATIASHIAAMSRGLSLSVRPGSPCSPCNDTRLTSTTVASPPRRNSWQISPSSSSVLPCRDPALTSAGGDSFFQSQQTIRLWSSKPIADLSSGRPAIWSSTSASSTSDGICRALLITSTGSSTSTFQLKTRPNPTRDCHTSCAALFSPPVALKPRGRTHRATSSPGFASA